MEHEVLIVLNKEELSQVRICGGPKNPERVVIVLADGRVWEVTPSLRESDDGKVPCISVQY